MKKNYFKFLFAIVFLGHAATSNAQEGGFTVTYMQSIKGLQFHSL